MPAPVFQTAGTGSATGGATVAVTKPTGLADNDVVIVAIAGSDADLCAAPDGTWTEHFDSDLGAVNETLAIYSHVVTNAAGEPASWTFTNADVGHRVGGALRVSGAHTTTPVVVVGTKATGLGVTATATAVTPGVVDCLLIQCSAANGNGTWSHSVMTERVDVQTTGGNTNTNASLQMATETLTASTSTGTRGATLGTSDDWTTVLLAIQEPAAAGRRDNRSHRFQAVHRSSTW